MTRSVLLAALAALPLAASCAPGPPPEASIVWGGAGASTPPRLPRPPLPLGADSNSAEAYTTHGRAWLNRAPDTAAAAFEWALKLDPEYAYAYHGRAVAMLIAYAEPTPRAIPAWRFRASVPVERLRYVDSLNMHALLLDPFFEPQFEYLFMGGLQFPSYHTVKDPAMAGYLAYRAREYEDASRLLADALRKNPRQPALRALRARAEYQLRHYDSSAAELERLATTLDQIDSSRTVLFYQSREMVYYALGAVQSLRHDTAAARSAYERALVENLAMYMAHARLAGLAFERRDTAAALAELAAGDEAGASDPAYQYYHGLALSVARRPRDAAIHLLRAVDLAPYFAAPHYYLGRLFEDGGDFVQALTAYEGFVARAPRAARALPEVRARMNALRARVDSVTGQPSR